MPSTPLLWKSKMTVEDNNFIKECKITRRSGEGCWNWRRMSVKNRPQPLAGRWKQMEEDTRRGRAQEACLKCLSGDVHQEHELSLLCPWQTVWWRHVSQMGKVDMRWAVWVWSSWASDLQPGILQCFSLILWGEFPINRGILGFVSREFGRRLQTHLLAQRREGRGTGYYKNSEVVVALSVDLQLLFPHQWPDVHPTLLPHLTSHPPSRCSENSSVGKLNKLQRKKSYNY